MEGNPPLLSFIILSSILLTSTATSTIRANQAIRDDDNDTTISDDQNFQLGFFSPSATSRNRYLGIWYYKKITTRTVVWVANRKTPLTDSSGVLVLNNGNLVLLNGTNSTIWSSNSTSSQINPVAQLLDTGNLVIRSEISSDPKNYVWQSFDYPGDTLLPSMKFGIDFVRGLNKYLTSWKNIDDPSPGEYTEGFDFSGYPQILLRKGSEVQYSTGPWIGRRFSGSQNLKPNSFYTFEFVLDEKELYYKYELTNSSVLSRMILKPSGITQRFIWVERTQEWELYANIQTDNCDRYGLCGAYGVCNINNSPPCGCLTGFEPKFPQEWSTADWSNGCVRKTRLYCDGGDGFKKQSGMKLPDTRKTWFNTSMNLKECEIMCLGNCSCTAYANTDVRGGGSGCLLWFDDLMDLRIYSEDGQDVYVRMAASEFDRNAEVKKRVRIIVIIPTILLTVSGLLGICLLIAFKRRKQKKKEVVIIDHGKSYTNETEKKDWELPLFDFNTLVNATSNFSDNCRLGEGGFGPVYKVFVTASRKLHSFSKKGHNTQANYYLLDAEFVSCRATQIHCAKGVLDDGQEIAVKRHSIKSMQGLEEFKNEVQCIVKLQHRNLVRLLGCCIEEGERMLIYEYMPNNSLNSIIFDEGRRKTLDWSKRYNIITGIARGLLYLHQDSRLRIIHRDLKASNVLLDKEMNPRISDFGLARTLEGTDTEANTKRVMGTYGYMSPEYAIDGIFSTKSDVFSFGVLVIEIVSGSKNRGFQDANHDLNLLGHAWKLYQNGKLEDLIDKAIRDSYEPSEMHRAIHIGLLCVQKYPEDRPSMPLVVLMLGSDNPLPEPRQPGFYTERRKPHEGDSSSTNPEWSSLNYLTITSMEPR